MKKGTYAGVGSVLLAALVWAAGLVKAGEYRTLAVRGTDVAVTNSQATSVWSPTAALLRFESAPTGVVGVARVSGGVEYVLSVTTNRGVSFVWFAEQTIYFKAGDVFKVYSGGGTGTVQVMRKAGE
jgi:hypothetical protein